MGPPAINEMFEYYTPSRDLRSGNAMMAIIPKCNTQFGTKKPENTWSKSLELTATLY